MHSVESLRRENLPGLCSDRGASEAATFVTLGLDIVHGERRRSRIYLCIGEKTQKWYENECLAHEVLEDSGRPDSLLDFKWTSAPVHKTTAFVHLEQNVNPLFFVHVDH